MNNRYIFIFYSILKHLWRFTVLGLFLFNPALAEDIDLEISGQLNVAGKYSKLSPTNLVVDPAASGYDDGFTQAVGIVNATVKYKRWRAHSQLRAESLKDKTEAFIDEAYGEFLLGESVFLYAGRRILSYGQSYGLNPVDFLHDPVAENSIFPSSQSRSMSQGADLIGMDVVFDLGTILSLIHIPSHDNPRLNSQENINMVRYSGFLEESNLDYAVSIISAKRPGAGFSLSKTIGNSSVLYADVTARRGREKQAILGTVTSGQLLIEPRKVNGFYTFSTLGFGYTHDNNVSINLELSHDAGGFSDQEWKQMARALDTISPTQSATHRRSLSQLNSTLNHHTLRKNYAFLRVANDKILDSPISAEVTSIYGIDDGSGSVGLRLETPLGERTTSGLYVRHGFGDKNDEFTLRPETDSVSLYMTVAF